MIVRRPAVLPRLLILALAASSRTAGAPPRPILAIEDVTVIDAGNGVRLPHRTVTIEGGRITSVAPSARRLPAGAIVVKGQGRFLIPGLWDMHVHAAANPRVPGLLLASGITGARDMGGEPSQVLEARRRIEAGDLAGPRLLVAGPALAGPPSEADNSTWVVRTPEEATRAVASLAGQGVDFIKVHDHLPRETFRAVIEAAKSRRLPVAGHVSEHSTPAEASALGQKSIEHFEFLPKPCMALFNPDAAAPAGCDRAALHSLMRTFARNGTWLDPTAGAFRYFAPAQWATIQSVYRNLVALMRANAVRVLAGTDLSRYLESKGAVPGQSLHEELAFLVDAGFTPAEALRAATAGPAEFLGLARTTGAIRVGYSADLVLLEADPLLDIRNTQRVTAVIRQGRHYDEAALQLLRSSLQLP